MRSNKFRSKHELNLLCAYKYVSVECVQLLSLSKMRADERIVVRKRTLLTHVYRKPFSGIFNLNAIKEVKANECARVWTVLSTAPATATPTKRNAALAKKSLAQPQNRHRMNETRRLAQHILRAHTAEEITFT